MEEINLKDLFNYFMSKILIFIITTVLILLLGNIYSLVLKTPLYKSTTSLVLVNESDKDSITQSDLTLNNNLVGTYTEIIKSRNVLGQVVNNLRLKESTGSLSSKINVTSVSNSQIIKINVSDADNKKAKLIADEIAKVFISETSKLYKLNNIKVIDEASIENSPYNMNIIKENIIYLAIGCALGLGIILLIYSLDTTIKTTEDVEEKLELTVLGNVPKVGDKNE